MQQHGSKYFDHRPPTTLGVVKRSNSTFQNMVMLHTKLNGNDACSIMVKDILPADPTSPWRWVQKVKIQLYQNMVMMHITLNGITNAATW